MTHSWSILVVIQLQHSHTTFRHRCSYLHAYSFPSFLEQSLRPCSLLSLGYPPPLRSLRTPGGCPLVVCAVQASTCTNVPAYVTHPNAPAYVSRMRCSYDDWRHLFLSLFLLLIASAILRKLGAFLCLASFIQRTICNHQITSYLLSQIFLRRFSSQTKSNDPSLSSSRYMKLHKACFLVCSYTHSCTFPLPNFHHNYLSQCTKCDISLFCATCFV